MNDIKIGAVAGNGFYICRPHGDEKARLNGSVRYLHKDFTWQDLCGNENFYKTLDEAKKQIKIYEDLVLGKRNPFIDEQEMML